MGSLLDILDPSKSEGFYNILILAVIYFVIVFFHSFYYANYTAKKLPKLNELDSTTFINHFKNSTATKYFYQQNKSVGNLFSINTNLYHSPTIVVSDPELALIIINNQSKYPEYNKSSFNYLSFDAVVDCNRLLSLSKDGNKAIEARQSGISAAHVSTSLTVLFTWYAKLTCIFLCYRC